MSAANTRLTKYTGSSGTIYAAKITDIVPFNKAGAPPGSLTLTLGELDKKSNLVGAWVAQHNPAIGGYFVVYDAPDGQTLCRYESSESMAKNYAVQP